MFCSMFTVPGVDLVVLLCCPITDRWLPPSTKKNLHHFTFSARGGRDVALSSFGLQAMAVAAEIIAPVTATPTQSTPSPSPAQQRADANRGTWRSARPP